MLGGPDDAGGGCWVGWILGLSSPAQSCYTLTIKKGGTPEEPTKENEMLNITTETDTTSSGITVVITTFTSDTTTDRCVLDAMYQDSTMTSLMVLRPRERPVVYSEDLEEKFAEHYDEFTARYA